MYEFLKKYIGENEGGNRFWIVPESDIKESEYKLGFLLPLQLKEFYLEVGCGFLSQSKIAELDDEWNNINRIIGPTELADIYLGKDDYSPPEGFTKGFIPFFDIGESTFFIIKKDESDLGVYGPGTIKRYAENLEDFIIKLYANPNFYNEI